jgi:hypothetical protein
MLSKEEEFVEADEVPESTMLELSKKYKISVVRVFLYDCSKCNRNN